MQPFLQVNLLGEFSVRWENHLLVEPNARTNKNLELLAILLLYQHQPLSNEQLMNFLWEEKASNPAGALKNTVYSLRKILEKHAPSVSFIVTTDQQYQFNPAITLQADFLQVSEIYQQLQQKNLSITKQLELGRQALQLYKADLLPCFSHRPWLIERKQLLLQQYAFISANTAQILLKENRFSASQEALSICSRAIMLAPQQEELSLSLFQALYQLEMKTAVLNYYPIAVEMCYHSFSKPVARSLRQIYFWASEQNFSSHEDLMRIRADLQKIMQKELPLQGAYFCNYNELQEIYPMIARTASRNGNTLAILLLSLHPKNKFLPTKQESASAMAALYQIIRNTLRKGDIFCRFSRFQYVSIVSMAQYSDCSIVKNRLSYPISQESLLENFSVQIDFTSPDFL